MRVVCIRDDWNLTPKAGFPPPPKSPPKKGEIYTEIPGAHYPDCICLAEYGTWISFLRDGFRPVDLDFGEVIAEVIERKVKEEETILA